MRDCGNSTAGVGAEDKNVFWASAGPYQDEGYVSGGVSDYHKNNTKSDTRMIRILDVSDTYAYLIHIGYAIHSFSEVSV